MSNTIPIPQPDAYEYLIADVWRTQTHWNGVKASAYRCLYATEKVHAHAAAVSAADSAALRAELAKHQESEFHPDWSMLEATRESLAEHQQIIRALRERVKLLEGFALHLESILVDLGGCSCIPDRVETLSALRAALGDKT